MGLISKLGSIIPLCFVILCLDLDLIQTSDARNSYSPHGTALCFLERGLVRYNAQSKICCDRKLTNRVHGQACCNRTTLYYERNHVCCGGKVIPKQKRHECCGGQLINSREAMCCNDTPQKLSVDQLRLKRDFLQCCDKRIYDARRKLCCGGETYPREGTGCCEGKVFPEDLKHCMRGRILVKDERLCGSEVYNIYKKSCCSGVLHNIPERNISYSKYERNPKFECCDNLAMDPTKEQCCRKHHHNFSTHTIPQEPHLDCCGTGFFNKSHQICVEGQPLENESDKEWCGVKFVDGKVEKCCGSSLPFMAATHKCCFGTTNSVIEKDQECCNGVGVKENELCCAHMKPVAKRDKNDDACCFNTVTLGGLTYLRNSTNECVEGEVIRKPNKDHKLCRRSDETYDSYDPMHQFCCGSKVVNFSSGFNDCCNERPYNNRNKLCCWDNQLSDISPKEGSCCTRDGHAHKFDDPANPCVQRCQGKTFNRARQICCKGRVYPRRRNTICCGPFAISKRYKRCCAGRFPYHIKGMGHKRCCGRRDTFRKTRSRCKNNQIVPRKRSLRGRMSGQALCHKRALKSFDGAIEHACRRKYAITGNIADVKIERGAKNETIIISLSDVENLDRGKGFQSWKGGQILDFRIQVLKGKKIKCRVRYLKKIKKVIFFFNEEAEDGIVVLPPNAFFFMTKHNERRELLVTLPITKNHCKRNYKGKTNKG